MTPRSKPKVSTPAKAAMATTNSERSSSQSAFNVERFSKPAIATKTTAVPVSGTVGEERLDSRSRAGGGGVRLARVAASGEDWSAYAYSPTGRLIAYRQGARLADGSLRTIQSTDVLLDTEEGPLRVFLPPGRIPAGGAYLLFL